MKLTKPKIATITLALLLFSSTLLVISNFTVTIADTQNADYGDVMQYEFPQHGGNQSWTRFGTGPAPATGDILWRTKTPDLQWGPVAAGGKVFGRTATSIIAFDPFDGSILWTAEGVYGSSLNGMFAADINHLVAASGYYEGAVCLDANTGEVVWTHPYIYIGGMSCGYGAYVPETKQYYGYRYFDFPASSDPETDHQQMVVRWDLSDISEPPELVWKTSVISSAIDQGLVYGDGKIFGGSAAGFTYAIDAETGDYLWKTPTKGSRMYSGCYYMDRYFHGAGGNQFYCFNATTGELLWTFNPGTSHGNWACGPAAAYGIVYGLNYDTHFYALNVTTGEVVWKYKGPGHAYPNYPLIADGKVYCNTGSDDYRNPDTGEYGRAETVCLNATTGELIWKLPVQTVCHDGPISAYGNIYLQPNYIGAYPFVGGLVGNEMMCIGSLDGTPKDWPMHLGDPAHTSEGTGPTNLAFKWKTNVNGAVISAPTIVDGITYVGSGDKNIYALDAETGNKIWNFTTGFNVFSSQAVVDGKVYTGADDGNIYCLDAQTGTQLWKTPAGGIMVANRGSSTYVRRSSPTVVSGKVYVGSLDGNLYCLNANTGTVNWKFQSPGPIFTTPCVIANDGVYFSSSNDVFPGNGTLFKLNPDNGNVVWEKKILTRNPGYALQYFELNSPPVVANGKVFVVDSDQFLFCLNATDGSTIWTWMEPSGQSSVYYGAVNYDKYHDRIYVPSLFALNCVNGIDGETIWTTWLNREVLTSITRTFGKVYAGNEEGYLYVLDADTGEKLSWYRTHEGSNIWSSPSLYNNDLYIGTHDFNVYCFEEAPPPEPYTPPPEPTFPTVDEIAQKVVAALPDSPSAGDIAQKIINQLPAYPEYPEGITAEEVAQKVLDNLPDYPAIPSAENVAQEILNQLAEEPEAPAYTTIDLVILAAVVVAIVIGVVSIYITRKQQK
ncbi:Outer membrane protein assembly factor BamB [subsurface metagenome]